MDMNETIYTIYTEKEIDPFNIAIIADLHSKPYSMVINSLNKLHPDVIAIVGDVVNLDSDPYPLEFFNLCSCIAPTFFSLGNHERKITEKQINDIKSIGAVVLDNIWLRFRNVFIGGMTSPFVTEWRNTHQTVLHYALPDISWLDEFEKQNGFKILLDHHPENYGRVTRDRDIDLILSGHAHGGQIRLFGYGLYAPHQGVFPKYTSGVYDNRLVVSRGLGNIKPIPRIGNPTELVYVKIQSSINNTKRGNQK